MNAGTSPTFSFQFSPGLILWMAVSTFRLGVPLRSCFSGNRLIDTFPCISMATLNPIELTINIDKCMKSNPKEKKISFFHFLGYNIMISFPSFSLLPLNPSTYPSHYLSNSWPLFISFYIYAHKAKYANTPCSVCAVLLLCVFSGWPLGIGQPVDVLFPGKDHFSRCLHSLAACSFLCNVEVSWTFSLPC